jgi:hypothetical protein
MDRAPFNLNMRAWSLVVLMMVFGGLLTAMGGKIWATKWVIFMGLLITFGRVFCIAAYSLLRQMSSGAKRSVEAGPLPDTELAGRADTTNKLLPVADNDFIPSAVEDTTELLKVPARRDPENTK